MEENDFVPLFDNILIAPETEETFLVTDNTLLTENAKVISIGPDVKNVKVGDIIGTFIFGIKHLNRNGKKYHTIRELPAFVQGKYTV